MDEIDNLLDEYYGFTYTCPDCGQKMVYEDEYEDTLVCDHCGYSVATEMYGEEEEEWYPTKEEIDPDDEDEDEDDTGEYYDPEYDE